MRIVSIYVKNPLPMNYPDWQNQSVIIIINNNNKVYLLAAIGAEKYNKTL